MPPAELADVPASPPRARLLVGTTPNARQTIVAWVRGQVPDHRTPTEGSIMRSRSSLGLAAIAFPLLASTVAPVAAEPTFAYGAISVSATRYLFGSVAQQQNDIAPHGSPALASVLLHPVGMAPFPTSTSALPLGFVSATMTGTGFGGVGVSFISPSTPDHGAVARWTQDITNVGSSTGSLTAHFDIPRIEASLFAGPSYGTFPARSGPLASAGAQLTVTRFAADGTELSTRTLFDYFVSITRRFQGNDCENINEFTISDDLRARVPTGGTLIDVGDVCGLAFAPFSGDVTLASLAPGERLVAEYTLFAENLAWQSQTPELGYQAFVGDPFGIVGGGGLRIAPIGTQPPGTVPEPSPLALLLVGGLVALARAGTTRGGKHAPTQLHVLQVRAMQAALYSGAQNATGSGP